MASIFSLSIDDIYLHSLDDTAILPLISPLSSHLRILFEWWAVNSDGGRVEVNDIAVIGVSASIILFIVLVSNVTDITSSAATMSYC